MYLPLRFVVHITTGDYDCQSYNPFTATRTTTWFWILQNYCRVCVSPAKLQPYSVLVTCFRGGHICVVGDTDKTWLWANITLPIF